MSEKYKSRKNEPVYSSTYDNGGWPARDSLPTKDPIGDVEEFDSHRLDALRYLTTGNNFCGNKKQLDEEADKWVEGYKKWKSDWKKYEETVKPYLVRTDNKKLEEKIKKCTCGTHAIDKNAPISAHSDYCDLSSRI